MSGNQFITGAKRRDDRNSRGEIMRDLAMESGTDEEELLVKLTKALEPNLDQVLSSVKQEVSSIKTELLKGITAELKQEFESMKNEILAAVTSLELSVKQETDEIKMGVKIEAAHVSEVLESVPTKVARAQLNLFANLQQVQQGTSAMVGRLLEQLTYMQESAAAMNMNVQCSIWEMNRFLFQNVSSTDNAIAQVEQIQNLKHEVDAVKMDCGATNSTIAGLLDKLKKNQVQQVAAAKSLEFAKLVGFMEEIKNNQVEKIATLTGYVEELKTKSLQESTANPLRDNVQTQLNQLAAALAVIQQNQELLIRRGTPPPQVKNIPKDNGNRKRRPIILLPKLPIFKCPSCACVYTNEEKLTKHVVECSHKKQEAPKRKRLRKEEG